MSHFEYMASRTLASKGLPFYALIMAAMRAADTTNTAKLRQAFPDVHAEVEARYHAPGGVIPGDPVAADPPVATDSEGAQQ